ncbi:DUF2117 domain-containing protein [Methanofollis fontis]|uniref:DUF2117 domain-containing protein n=1 Tax=Methanofollis fontis TaxID=2052832 RepID=A0A483CWZ4_9EURY|nr:DUF2117 domain-containing protein [Methanofollis fontis]TAJ43547.1 hypothetical protein CUJ86_10480 [Methanofollis fontis]
MKPGDAPVMVVHGPEPFDRGDIRRLQEAIGPCRVLVAGIMARTAAEESGIACEFCGVPPSIVFARLSAPALLLNRGKTPVSGEVFGEIVAGRSDRPLIHVECSSDTVYCWNGDEERGLSIARALGYRCFRRDAPHPRQEGGERRIRGCIPGEPLFVNGIVIGTARAEAVVLRTRDGEVEAVSGVEVKPHGLEKLHRCGPVDLAAAWCKSGGIRTHEPQRAQREPKSGRIVLLDHCAHRFYDLVTPGTCGLLAVGDDTTAVAGHIASHLGIPVLGITDGDADGVVSGVFPPGSVVLEAIEGRDDELGLIIGETIPDGDTEWSAWVAGAVRTAGKGARIALDLR